jgi:DNA polymerase III subunit delta'
MPKKSEVKGKISWPEIGQEGAQSFLEKSLFSGRLAQTYIFLGPSDLGKTTLALAFAGNLLLSDDKFNGNLQSLDSGANSDLHILKKEEGKQQISVEQARQFMKMLNFSSFLNSYKIGIIKEADTLSSEAKSSLLKTLEEPKEKVVIILLTNDIASLPKTIISRAQIVRFYPVSSQFIYDYLLKNGEKSRNRAKAIASLSLGKLLKAKKLIAEPEFYEKEIEMARMLLGFFNLDLAQRRVLLEKYLKTDKDQLLLAKNLILVWEGVWRDLIMATIDQRDKLFYQDLKEDLLKISQMKKNEEGFFNYLLDLREKLRLTSDYLRANVNPQNALLSFIFYI